MPEAKKILFLDDDPDYLAMVQDELAIIAPYWTVFITDNPGRALGLIEEHRINLAVTDVHMPIVDGLQFLRILQRKFPNLLKVVMTSDTTGAYREASLSGGAELFLEKPQHEAAWHVIVSTLVELLKFQPDEGFRGVLRRVGLQDVLQMECLARNSSLLEISTNELQGTIYIEEGRIVHAHAGGRTGETAFNYLLALSGGEFNLKPFVAPAEHSLSGSWESLLMDAAQKRDEMVPEPASDPVPEMENFPSIATAPASVGSDGGEDSIESSARKTPRIDQFLICSPHGDVLYQWQCTNSNRQIDFVEFVSQKARQLAQGLPLGTFDRVELESANCQERLVAQIRPDHTLFLRSSKVSGAPSP